MAQKYKAVVIGSGPGGYIAALRLGNEGERVAMVESRELGGTCLNRGCIPTKALLHSSKIAASIGEAKKHGIEVGSVSIDLPAMMKRKDGVVRRLRGGVGMLMKSRKVDVYEGVGKLAGANKVEVKLNDGKTEVLETENVILATGSEPTMPKVFPDDRSKVMTSDEILELGSLPESMAIVGGGYIGCEFATVFSELGCEVMVVEMLDRLLPMADKDISAGLARSFRKKGIEVHCSTAVEKMELSGEKVKCTLGGGEVKEVSLALVCTGRQPRSAELGLEEAGVKLDKGFVVIDDQCRTSVANVFAIGDVTGKLQLAHVASRQAAVAVNTIMGKADSEDYAVVPSAVYTHPEIATVGLTEEQAREQHKGVRAAKFSMAASGMAMACAETDGFVKLLANGDDEIVGAHLMCPHASDMVQEVAVLMKSECTLRELEGTIHGHPTFCEALAEATEALLGRPLHGG